MPRRNRSPSVIVRRLRTEDFQPVIDLCRRVYPHSPPWSEAHLRSHLKIFPEGQLVAEETEQQRVVGMSASLILDWDDYGIADDWRDFTDRGYFTNHDPHGRTLYGAEIMVDPAMQGRGVGKKIYQARFELCRALKLVRIRAGARLPGYGQHAHRMSAEQYVIAVIHGELGDPTLSFQLKQGFHVLAVVKGYLQHDPASLGWAAVIEWINHKAARPKDYAGRDARFEG